MMLVIMNMGKVIVGENVKGFIIIHHISDKTCKHI